MITAYQVNCVENYKVCCFILFVNLLQFFFFRDQLVDTLHRRPISQIYL